MYVIKEKLSNLSNNFLSIYNLQKNSKLNFLVL